MSTTEHLNVNSPKSFAALAISAVAMASAALILAGASSAAPAGPGPVDQTVTELQSDGYQVFVNKVGSAPLNSCAISAVRPGQTYSRTDSGAPGAQDDLITTVTGKTAYVDVAC